MSGDTWPPGLTRLLVIALFLLASPLSVRAKESIPTDSNPARDEVHAARIQRDVNGVTTVLLVPAHPGKSVPPVGLLTKTARTFVQDGASTEYATQVLGTTLDNGRLYARILSTSSRVFYEKETTPEPSSPFVVYPSRAPQDEWQYRVNFDNTPVRVAKDPLVQSNENDDDVEKSSDRDAESSVFGGEIPSERENDIFNKRELDVIDVQRFKPAKVRAADNLPTYTVKQEYASTNEPFENVQDEVPRNFRPRVPKVFKPQVARVVAPKKLQSKPLATVTYHGFADFTTTVGDTIIVFSPSTSSAPVGRAATTIKGDATLRPDDGIGIIQPTSVIPSRERTNIPIQDQPSDPLLDAINGGRSDITDDNYDSLQPSKPSEAESKSLSEITTPLLASPAETISLNPTGLLKVIDSTTATDGTTTHYKSLIYGTYLGTNYAEIIQTSTNVYFFPDEATITYEPQDSTVDDSLTETDTEDADTITTLQMPTSTTPKPTTKAHKIPPETNQVTTPYRDTTENILTTLKDILANAKNRLSTTTTEAPDNIELNTDSDITNDIAVGHQQGRSLSGASPKNKFVINEKDQKIDNQFSFSTRLLPSTEYKTATFLTTLFIPDNDRTTTSVISREVVTSEVTYLTELVVPSAVVESSQSRMPSIEHKETTTSQIITTTEEPEEEQTTKQDEEIELIFKTLYTTYTYLTTFFQESTSTISSSEVVETNVVTQTVGPNAVSEDVAGLFDRDESVLILATSVSKAPLPTITTQSGRITDEPESFTTEAAATTLEETTEGMLTTIQDQDTTIDNSMDFSTSDDEEDLWTNLEPSPTPSIATDVPKEQIKTYFTTYTYFTTIFVDDETEIETRTEVFTNVVTEGIQPTTVTASLTTSSAVQKPTSESPRKEPSPPPEILAYLEALRRKESQEQALLQAKKVQEMNHHDALGTQETTINDYTTESMSDDDVTTIDEKYVTDKSFVDFQSNGQVTPNPPVDGEVLGSMITDVVSSSSSGGGTVLGIMDKRNAVPEDQELSESNHHDVESALTLLLQTSYTTFTYFTTMYKGDATNVVSRLDTVTNVVTETIRPTVVLPAETSTLPVTYFTTFTYWTTFYKGGDTVTTSREETVSNIVTPGVSPTPTLELGVIMTYRPDATDIPVDEDTAITKEPKVVADNEVTLPDLDDLKIDTEKNGIITPKAIVTLPENPQKVEISTISPEPTTFYTTFTYFTTSYIGNETILNSRLETITSVARPEAIVGQATGRAINGDIPSAQAIDTVDTIKSTVNESVKPSSTSEDARQTGLISTIRQSKVNEGTTTHFATDVYGTYIDGLYAQIVESSSRLETSSPSSSPPTPVLPTGILSLNKGSIIDADEVTTVYFTTKQIGTVIDGLYAKVIESTSSTKIDAEKKATITPMPGHRTGLVRLIQGHIETNDVTTVYQSKVIGTSIDGRYAQIIESTSSFVVTTPTASISPSSTLPPTSSTGIPEISPSPAVVQSSLSEDPTAESADNEDDETSEQSEEGEDGEGDSEDEDGQKSRKKSRLTFSSRKRTFTPVIRPFLSRSRPTFNPKRKGAQAATTITRTDITPTITATLAGKGNRFASSRGRASSPSGSYSSTLASSGSRRFSGRGRGPSNLGPSSTSGYPAGSSRGRGTASRIAPSSSFSVNRRGPSSIRGSSARPGPRGSSSIYPGASSRFRPGIRPSSTLNKIQPTIRHEDQDDEANEFSTTTLTTEEAPHTEYDDDGETVTIPLQTTTESSRRSTNPLLRFRRPLNLPTAQRTAVTPRGLAAAPTSRRNANLGKQITAPSGPSRSSVRGGNRPNSPLATRSRQSAQLFPPRGLLNRKPDPIDEPIDNDEEYEGEDDENFEDDPVEEIADNDYEGSEDAATTTKYNGNRRQGKAVSSTATFKPIGTYRRGRRVRRQASQLRSLTNRFRRPTSSVSRAEDRFDVEDSASREESNRSAAPIKQSSRYTTRGRSLASTRPSPHKTSAERFSAESTESLVKPRVRTNPRVKPSPTSGPSRQFTLREKDSTSRPGYKRTTPTSLRNRSPGKQESGVRVRPRVRNGPSRVTEAPLNNRRNQPTRPSSRSSNTRNGNRKVTSHRGRGSHEDIRESPFIHKNHDGTITVTHYVPTEVTIPIVNNGITEQRNIITAHPSTEVLSPDQYSTVVGGDGRSLVVIVSQSTGTNPQGQLEVTRFLLHETPTTRVSHTLTTLGGRRASQSIIVPSTVYSVENVISTAQPTLPNANGPLANILLSQLLLGQLNQQNAFIGGGQPQGTPTTEYKTRTTSYVTTITKHQSTVIPLTFRGKEILTTLIDSSTDVVTATEFITDTVVVTPTAILPAAGLNSLLLLLQQPQQQQQSQHPLLDPLFAAAPLLTQSNTLPGEVERRHQPADFDYRPNNYDDSEEEIIVEKPVRTRVRNNAAHRYSDNKKEDRASQQVPPGSSIVTLYVSGKRPGEFSTVLTTVKIGEEATVSRRRRNVHKVQASAAPSLHAATETGSHLAGSEEPVNAHVPTQSLESVVDETLGSFFEAFGKKQTRDHNPRWKSIEEDQYGSHDDYDDNEDPRASWRSESEPPRRKVIRVRVPVIRSKTETQHKYTVVRRRPLVTYKKSVAATPTARRVVVTRLRSRGPVNQLLPIPGDFRGAKPLQSMSANHHRVTVTRRRKIRPTSTRETLQKPKVTRKKLVTVRPVVEPTPTFEIITTGFYGVSTTSEEDDESVPPDDEELPIDEITEPEINDNSEKTPNLEESPNEIDSKPEEDFEDGGDEEPSRFELIVPQEPSKVEEEPVIITDNFFFPASDNDNDEENEDADSEKEEEQETEDYEDGDYAEPATGINANESVSTEEPRLKFLHEDKISEDEIQELPEATSPQITTPITEAWTEIDGKTTETIEGQTEEITDAYLTTTENGVTESALSTDQYSMDVPKTEISMDASNPTTIRNEETDDDTIPQTTPEASTISNEEENIDMNNEQSTLENIAMITDEPGDETTTILPDIELTVESIIFDTSSESPVTEEVPKIMESIEPNEDDLRVLPIESYEKSLKSSSGIDGHTLKIQASSTWSPYLEKSTESRSKDYDFATIESDVPSVIPLETDSMSISSTTTNTIKESTASITTYASPTTEDIEAGLADELYLSLSRPDFPQILPSKSVDYNVNIVPTPELSTSVYYTETVVTSTKLRTYTYVVTKLNGLETEVTSSTTVRPRITTLTLTVPITVTIPPNLETSTHNNVVVAPVYSPVPVAEYEVEGEDEGRRFHLATRVMSNGVEVIVAGPTPALRWENSNPQPTLTLSDTVVMLMPQEDPNEFVTKTCTTTFTYLNTITKDGATIVSTDQQVVANTATEERHRKPGTESASVTLESSPTLSTEVFKTTYTYLTLNTDHPDADNALGSSMKVITNTVTAPQHYLDVLEPSEVSQPETNTYLSTRVLEKTFMEDGRTKIETTSDTVTQLIITESAPPPPKPTSVTTTLTALDNTEELMTDITKTYFITYTYSNTYLEKGSTVIHTNVATSTDIVLEKVPAKKTTVQSVTATPTPEPIQIFATKTYLTTFTYFTTLLQAGADGETSTTISSRSHIVENVVTESIAPSLLDPGYMNTLLTTAHHSDSVKNVVTGSTIIFFDEEDQIDPTTATSSLSQSTVTSELENSDKVLESTPESPQAHPTAEASGTEAQSPDEQPVISNDSENSSTLSSEDTENTRPSTTPGNPGDLQVSNLLSLGSLGINSLSALGPVITAMAGLLQGKPTATRRNDSVTLTETQEVTTQRSPIYIPVAEFADGDIETAESQNIVAQLANSGLNYIPETRHKVAASLADGIPISPGEVITANTDVIIGKPGKLGPRPPHGKGEEHIGMKPPPMPVPNIPVHPVLEVMHDDQSDLQAQSSIQSHRNTQIQILSAHQVYEKHLKVPGPSVFSSNSQGSAVQKRTQQIPSGSPLRQAINKEAHLHNDPLLIPPSRPNVEQYANPNINPKDSEWNRERFRRPWSAKDPLTPPSSVKYDEIPTETSQENKPWQNRRPTEEQKRPPWAQKDPLLADTSVILESSETKTGPSEPIIHQVPHVIDRSTGQPLLVNIQPSQVANVVIPQGGTQALIFGDTIEPHISGQYFDDPSPYPEPEVGPGFIGVEKIENNPADYMVPPAPPLNFKLLPQQSNNRDHPQTIPLSHSQSHFNLGRPLDNSEITSNTRFDKRPSEVMLIQRPETHGQTSGQGHVHTEILVHHRPESVNVRPQVASHSSSHLHGIYSKTHEPPRRDSPNHQSKPSEQPPPRRTEIISAPTESPHQRIYLDNKPFNEASNDVKLKWKFDRKPQRNPSNVRPDRHPERPLARPHSPSSYNYPIFERPEAYPSRKPQYPSSASRPHSQGSIQFESNPAWHTPNSQESPKMPATNQARPFQSYPKESFSRPTNVGHDVIVPAENVPTGAIGYHNPSNEPKVKPVDTQYYPQLPTIKPEIQSFGEILPHPESEHEVKWQVDTQTERSSADSDSDASENINFQKDPEDHHDETHGHIDKQDEMIDDGPPPSSPSLLPESSSSNVETDNHEIKILTPSSYETVGSVNTVVGKPVGFHQSVNYENQNSKPPSSFESQSNQGHSVDDYGQERYTDSYDNPIVQGKPYGVYRRTENDKIDISQSHQEDNNRPDYEVIQGIPFSQHGGKQPALEQRPTARPYDHDDTIDLKPPAMISQFGGSSERPGRPFSRPHSRPASRPRPEHNSQRTDTNKNRPVINRDQTSHPISSLNESDGRIKNSQTKENSYPPPYEWAQGPEILEKDQSASPVRNDHRDQFLNVEGGNHNSDHVNQMKVEADQAGSYFPSNSGSFQPNDKTDQSMSPVQAAGIRVHPAYPHILTKPRPRVPGPITISSDSSKHDMKNGRPKIQFSLPVEATGEEKDSLTQTERPPSMLITANGHKNKKQKQETLVTASQTNFATSGTNNQDSKMQEMGASGQPTQSKKHEALDTVNGKPKVPSQNMMPPPLRKNNGKPDKSGTDKADEVLKPPPHPSHVVGLSPPPVAITTTGRPKEERYSFTHTDETDLRPPPKYIPLKDTAGAVKPPPPPPPSTSMVPPRPKPSLARPFLADLLSQDMVPPPLVIETSRAPMEITTVRPAIAVSGSIQIATAIAASHIPVMQDSESKIPIIHGTVDLPIVMDMSNIMKPLETERPEHVSIYTVRPFETRPVSRVSVQPTTIITSNLIMPTKRISQIGHVETMGVSISRINAVPTRSPAYHMPRKPTKRPDHPVFLEPSRKPIEPSMAPEATQSLIRQTNRLDGSVFQNTQMHKYTNNDNRADHRPSIVTRVHSSISRTTNTLVPQRDKVSKTKELLGSVLHEVVKNGTAGNVEMKPKAITHFRTLTVTRTETSVLGSPPTTRTLLLTHTLTSTIVETVTETLLRPTSVVATVTSTILQSITRLPNSYENAVDNDSIFVVMSDQNPPAPGAEEVEAEYSEDEVSRDEQDPTGNEINRVLAGGILGAPIAPMRPAVNQCQPECKASKAEVCSETGTEARCVCRPGFARMFPDRPCKPTYTYTLRVGLERMGREPVFYEAALNDTSSMAFRRLAVPTREALDRTMMQSDLRDVYRSLDIAGFKPNPIQVEFHVQLTDNANETRLKEVLRKYIIGSNYSLGGTEVFAARDLETIEARDFDECATHEGGPHHDCSPHAGCFNLRGSYQCSCAEGWADLSENPAYPGRVCSQAPLGCAGCNNKGHCTTNVHGHEVCECFPWHSGQRCQVNLKVLLIALVTTGAILLGLLAVCLGLACFRHPGRGGKSGDRRAMIPGAAGDTSSEGSVTDLAIPHHVPHVLPPPPRSVAPAPPAKRPARKIGTPSGKRCRSPRKASIAAPVAANEEQCDRSLTVMIPRAKYRSTPQLPRNYKSAMSTFGADEHKLISYLESGAQSGNRRLSTASTKEFGRNYDESDGQIGRSAMTGGALVSAGFQVSATVTRTADAESTMARSCAETAQVEPSTKNMRSSNLQCDVGSTLARSCGETSTSTKLLRLDFGDSSGSTMAKSCGETTIQTSTKMSPSRRSDSKDTRDVRGSGSEGHMTMERDLESTLRLTPQHPALYKPDRTSDRDSNFDSL